MFTKESLRRRSVCSLQNFLHCSHFLESAASKNPFHVKIAFHENAETLAAAPTLDLEADSFENFLAMIQSQASTDTIMNEDDPPADTPRNSGPLELQLDDLCDNISRLQQLLRPRQPSAPASLAGQRATGVGDFEPQPIFHDMTDTNEEVNDLSDLQQQHVDTSTQTQTVPFRLEAAPIRVPNRAVHNPRPRHKLATTKPVLYYSIVTFFTIVRVLIFATCFLTCVSILTAMWWDQDFVDPYLDEYFGGTVLEGPLISIRNNWQIPLQNELQCLCPHFPIFLSPRRRFWDVIHSFFYRTKITNYCIPEKTIYGRLCGYVWNLWSKPAPPWSPWL